MAKTRKKPSEIFDQAALEADPEVQALIQAGQDQVDGELDDAKKELAAQKDQLKEKAAQEADLQKRLKAVEDLVPDEEDEFLAANNLTPADLDPDADGDSDDDPFLKANDLTSADLDSEEDPDLDPFLAANNLTPAAVS